MESLLLVQVPIARRAELTVLLPGVAEKRRPGASERVARRARKIVAQRGPKPVDLIVVGRVRTSITSFSVITVSSVPCPFRLQMAKAELKNRSKRPLLPAARLLLQLAVASKSNILGRSGSRVPAIG